MTIALSEDFLEAYSEIQKSQQKQVREFIERFRVNPAAPGINFETIQSAKDKNLFSVRINQAYRAIVYHPSKDVYVLTWVDHHDDAYRWAEKKRLAVHPDTGALQIVPTEIPEVPPEKIAAQREASCLFDGIKDKHLLRLGVPETALPLVRSIASEAELYQAESELPQEAYEALFYLAAGSTVEEILRDRELPEQPAPVDTSDIRAALANEDSQRRFYVVPDDKDLAEVLSAPLAFWRVFLHPKQRTIAAMNANGPVRILGGAGTGKTVVAMHRAKHLVSNVFTGKTDRILFTTFTRNLATDIFENLRTICTVNELSRIEVVNLDQWVSNFLRSRNYSSDVVFGADGNEAWQAALNQKDLSLGLSDEFYRSEWEQVVQLQDIRDADAYMRASRLGRGTRLGREKKIKIWPVFQEYRALLNEQGKKEFIDLLRDARCLIETKKMEPKYRAVIVDEAQDMSNEAFRLIRLLAAPSPNDLFIVGDAHQRIYRYKVSLGQCGIDIRGRGKKLKLNYRTTEEIRRVAVRLLEGKPIDDLDSGIDDQAGFLSLTHGEPPVVQGFPTFSEELAFVRDHIQKLADAGVPLESICVIGRTNQVVALYQDHIENSGMKTYQIKRNVAEQTDKPGLRLATMHRVKGLEFEHVVVVSVNDGLVPLKAAVEEAEDDVARGNAELSERSLLYVALTRAKKSALIAGYGRLSPFLS